MTQLDLTFVNEPLPGTARHPGLRDAATVLELLHAWLEAGWVQQLDVAFARFLLAEQPDTQGLLLLAAALASHQLGRGHVCLDLAATLRGPGQVLSLPPDAFVASSKDATVTPAQLFSGLALCDWEAALHPAVVSDGSHVAPLVYDGGRLYLYRYWRYEQAVARSIADRVAAPGVEAEPSAQRVRAILDVLFGQAPANGATDWQRLACALAARTRFSIVTGGPGTGKTTTVIRLLALLQALHHESHQQAPAAPGSWRPLRIQLAAPTGKAAARLSESIAGKIGELPVESLPGGASLAGAIPARVVTLHSLLGGRPHSQSRRYNADNPLPLDVLVVDEASMVSLSDMAHLVAALPPAAQLVLIGDKDQLSSVEAGSVLGELCRRADDGHYLSSTAGWLEAATGMALPAEVLDPAGKPLDQSVAMLRTSYRFSQSSGIGKLATAVNRGKADDVEHLLASAPVDVVYAEISSAQERRFARLVVEGVVEDAAREEVESTAGGRAKTLPRSGYRHYLHEVARLPITDDPAVVDAWAAAVLRAQRACQILCVLRNGPWGVEGLNVAISRILHDHGLIPALSGWYAGRPVMVTRNNRALRLANGDIGVVLPYPTEGGKGRSLRVAFPDAQGEGVRWFAPNRLEDVETVYALTVHKSQGSEFHHAVLVLPPATSPVLTRELVYTGITRASKWFTLVNPGGIGLVRQVIGQRVYRSGGLGDVLDAME